MSICISVKVAEGLVLAADSATIISGEFQSEDGQRQSGVIQSFDYANKVSQMKHYPIGVMSWGTASIGDRTIESIVMEWEIIAGERAHQSGYTVKDIADSFLNLVKEKYSNVYGDSPAKPHLGLFVGGYSEDSFFSDLYTLTLPVENEWETVRPDKNGRPDFGSTWFGQGEPLRRLIKGYADPITETLQTMGEEGEKLQKELAKGVEHPIIFHGMPLQDAIDFAKFAVEVVIGYYRFGPGPSICGGEVDIAVITPKHFRWARKKQWALKG